TIASYFSKASTLSANTGNKQEVIWCNLAYIAKHFSSGGTHHIHHVVFVAPFLRFFDNLLKELFTTFFNILKVVCTLIRSQSQQDNPFAYIGKEWLYRILSHIWCNSHCVKVHGIEEGPCIEGRGIAYITSLGISNYKDLRVFVPDVVYCLLKTVPTIYTHAFIESQIGLISDSQIMCSINYFLVEGKDGI